MATDRKTSYKAPPTIITDRLISQESRRSKALEEQKRRRSKRVDSSRQLDLFADLNLGPSDDEESEVVREGIAPFASMVGSSRQSEPSPTRSLLEPTEPSRSGKKKAKKKKRTKAEGSGKPNKWADKCMYAELLEMRDDDVWPLPEGVGDGLPDDLEMTHQSSGIFGVVPNTSLRSRVLGKSLMVPFPSNLPPQTVLDCILDPDWRNNGILHILDVLQWKGQDVGDCETPFRFWWRDTRLAELPRSLPPSNSTDPLPMKLPYVPMSDAPSRSRSPATPPSNSYQFPYPISFLPIPYHTNTTLPFLSSHVIPLARSHRLISIDVPITSPPNGLVSAMDIDNSLPPPPILTSLSVEVKSDGLLLYLSQASYEPGTSPLSSWIPITGYTEDQDATSSANQAACARPLDLFERLVIHRLAIAQTHGISHTAEVDTDMEA